MIAGDVIVVDTNIWMDYLFGHRAGNEAARRFLVRAKQEDVSLVVAPHSLSDVFFLVRSELKMGDDLEWSDGPAADSASARSAAWSVVDFILQLATVGPSDHMDALKAYGRRSVHGDYEDNLVVSCAERCKARLLVTNDEKLIKHASVPAMTANDAFNFLCS